MTTTATIKSPLAVPCLDDSHPMVAAPAVDGKTSLTELAGLINRTHGASLAFGSGAKAAARYAIEIAVVCGGYLRMAKSKVVRRQFSPWLRENTEITPRTARNYMALHLWVSTHHRAILQNKPQSLRQFYILAGILPEDQSRKPSKENRDDLARPRRLVRRTASEAAGHRDFADADALWAALRPRVALLEEVAADVQAAAKGKHVSAFA